MAAEEVALRPSLPASLAEWISSVISEQLARPTRPDFSNVGTCLMNNKCRIWFQRWDKFVARFVLLLERDNSRVNHRHAHLLPKCPHCRHLTQSTHWGLSFSMWSSDGFSLKSSDAQLGIRRRRNRLSSAFTTFYHGTKQRHIIPYWNSVSVSQFLLTFSQKSLFFARCFLLKNKFMLFFRFIHCWTLCLWKMQWLFWHFWKEK